MKLSNVIYCGDNLEWMRRMPGEFVDLIYADPPFFSNRHYEVIWNDGAEIRSFEDRWQGGINHYIEWMKDRCFQAHRILKPTGSFYLHCDWHASHYLKVMLDDLFGHGNFRNEVIWHYRTFHGQVKHYFARKHDVLLFYTKSAEWRFNRLFEGDYVDTIDYTRWHDYLVDGNRILGSRMPMHDTRFLRYYRRWMKENGREPGPKDVVFEVKGQALDTVWDIKAVDPKDQDRLGYPTQKPPELLRRVVLSSSDEGDLVLDPFCGCGTTLLAAHTLRRDWIGIDVSPTACKLVKRRMEQADAKGVDVLGLPMSVEELKALSHAEFQNHIIGAMGGLPSPKKVHDMGIDGYTFFDRIPVQAKQQEHVGRQVVDDFETALRRQGEGAVKAAKERGNGLFSLKGIIVAFSFTKGAVEEVARAKKDGLDIELLTVKDVVKEFEK